MQNSSPVPLLPSTQRTLGPRFPEAWIVFFIEVLFYRLRNIPRRIKGVIVGVTIAMNIGGEDKIVGVLGGACVWLCYE